MLLLVTALDLVETGDVPSLLAVCSNVGVSDVMSAEVAAVSSELDIGVRLEGDGKMLSESDSNRKVQQAYQNDLLGCNSPVGASASLGAGIASDEARAASATAPSKHSRPKMPSPRTQCSSVSWLRDTGAGTAVSSKELDGRRRRLWSSLRRGLRRA